MRKAYLIRQDTKERHDLTDVTMIGRMVDDSGIRITDPLVSRRHAMIRMQGERFWYFDLGSFNGSYINKRRVITSVKLKSGDQIQIGGYDYEFQEPEKTMIETRNYSGSLTMPQIRTSKAILFVTDIIGFTKLSESLEPAVLAQVMGSWYSFTEQICIKYGATVDKFIGDCALAYWTDTEINSRIHALQAADAMQKACNDTYEAHQQALNETGLTFGACVAIHIGEVAHGGFSSREFTIVGDAVNVTFRVEALTRKLQTRVLVTDDFLDGWEKGYSYCKNLGEHAVKGRAKNVTVHALEKIPGGG